MDQLEEWRPISNGMYEINKKGDIRRAVPGVSTFVGRPVLPMFAPAGYLQVSLATGGKKYLRAYVHRLVMEAFVGPCPEGHVVNHKDGSRTNNNLDNLEYVTQKENVQHALRTVVKRKGPTKPPRPLKGRPTGENHWSKRMPERIARGDKMPHAKMNTELVAQMRADRAAGMTLKKLKEKYSMSQASISRICLNKRWVTTTQGESQ